MKPKPEHLGRKYAEQFKDRSIVDAYRYRPLYPSETFTLLNELITDTPRTVLDIGCGRGDIARNLTNFVERVDAVDFSILMLEEGKHLPDGNHPHLTWIHGDVEDVDLNPPYALITAGESLHWMAWDVVFPRFRTMLTSAGYLAIITRINKPVAWRDAVFESICRYSTNRDFNKPYDLIQELEERQLFKKVGEKHTEFVPFVLSIDEYIESIHSRNGFSRERMIPEGAAAFDNEIRHTLLSFSDKGMVSLEVAGNIVWGKPQSL